MPSGQAFIDSLANTAIQYNDARSRPFVVNLKILRKLIAAEQAILGAAGQPSRTDKGKMTLNPLSGAKPVKIPTIVEIGGDGPKSGGNGNDVAIWNNTTDGHILIAAGGNAVSSINVGPLAAGALPTYHGGRATCIGRNECLVIALGGHGARTPNPSPLPPAGTDGSDGGDGGEAQAACGGEGNMIFAQGGDGKQGSAGIAGIPGKIKSYPFWGMKLTPGTPSGVDGDGGDGGWAICVGEDHTDFVALGGRAGWTIYVTLGPMLPGGTPTTIGGIGGGRPGTPGNPGLATVVPGKIDVSVVSINGDGSPGIVKK